MSSLITPPFFLTTLDQSCIYCHTGCLLHLQDAFFLYVDTVQEHHVSSDEEEGGDVQLELVEQTLLTLELREFEICPSRHRRRRRKKKEEIAEQSNSRSYERGFSSTTLLLIRLKYFYVFSMCDRAE